MANWNIVYNWPEVVDSLDFCSASQGAAATHPAPRRPNVPGGLWDEEKNAIGKLWISENGGSQWHLQHEEPGRLLLVQRLPDRVLAVREIHTPDRNPPLRHEVEALTAGDRGPVRIAEMPALVTGIYSFSVEQGYAWTAEDIYWTENRGRGWRKVAQRTPEPLVAKIESVTRNGIIYYVRSKRVYRCLPSSGGRGEEPLPMRPSAQAEAVCVDREQDAVVVATREGNAWVCAIYRGEVPELVERIDGAPTVETQAHYLHATNGEITFVTISTGTFLPVYTSYLRRRNQWRKEDISGARNLGALAFAAGRGWVARVSASENVTRLYRREAS
jgi:hypothetical protein